MKYYDYLENVDFWRLSFREKLAVLLNTEIIKIDDNKIDSVGNQIAKIENFDLDKIKSNHADLIATLINISWPDNIFKEVGSLISSELTKQKKISTALAIDLLEDYNYRIYAEIDLKSKVEITKNYIQHCVIALKHETSQIETPHVPLKSLTRKELLLFIELYFERGVNYESAISEELANNRIDIITHLKAPIPEEPVIEIYNIGLFFKEVYDLIWLINHLKDGLKNLNHEYTALSLDGNNIFSINNIHQKINRSPKVFKNAFNCELFIYVLSINKIDKPIIFSYFYSIFKIQKKFKNNISISDYLNFINSLYGLGEIRLRESALSSNIESKYINQLLKCENELIKKNSIKPIL